MLKEFKNFIMTRNVIDFAIAVILAGAVGMVVNGFVNDIMMPIVGHFAGGMDFSDLFHAMNGEVYATLAEAEESGSAIVKWGSWVNTIINLIIVGFVLFMMGRAAKKAQKAKEEAPSSPPADITLLTEIRDALKK